MSIAQCCPFVCCVLTASVGPLDSLIKLAGPSCRLAARGLEQDPHEESCSRYIHSGVGQVAQIVAKLDETNFYNTLTTFKADFEEVRAVTGGTGRSARAGCAAL